MPDDAELDAHVELILREDGDALLPRLIRYIEDRRARESRYTGAIEDHPSALTIVWGDQDPIAVVAMAHRLAERRPDATLRAAGRRRPLPDARGPRAASPTRCWPASPEAGQRPRRTPTSSFVGLVGPRPARAG